MKQHPYPALTFAILVGSVSALACGSADNEIFSSGGSANSGGAGSGGVGGSGGSSSGGASTGGSNSGGSNSGGASTGGSSSDGSGGSKGKAELVCQKIAQLPCAIKNCLGEIEEGYATAKKNGCVPTYDAVLDCALAKPLHCIVGKNGPQLDKSCEPALEAFEKCIGSSSSCAISGGPSSCSMSCQTWAASCKYANGVVYCQCTSGPKAGTGINFKSSCGGDNWQKQLASYCGN